MLSILHIAITADNKTLVNALLPSLLPRLNDSLRMTGMPPSDRLLYLHHTNVIEVK